MKEKIRRLSSVNSIQQSKIEFSDDCNVVDHTSVPRKLRSAMKKRGHEAISPKSTKPKGSHTGEKSHRKDCGNNPRVISPHPCSNMHRSQKRGGSDWSKKESVSATITKDEEEVVETLYVLAGMFSNGDSVEVKSSTPPETVESPVTVLEVEKEDTNSVQAAETVPLSTVDESSNETVPSSTQDQHDLPYRKKAHLELDSTIPEMRLNNAILSLATSEPDPADSSCIHGDFRIFYEPNLEVGLKQPKQHMTNPFETKPEMAFGLTTAETQIAHQHVTREHMKNGRTLWPGLSPTVPHGPQSTSSSQSIANAIPTWLDAANFGSRTCSLKASSSTEKVLGITRDRNAMKKATTHVYISRLVHNLQMQDNKDGILKQPLWWKPHVGLKQTAFLYPKNSSILKNGINGDIPGSTSGRTATYKNTYEDRSVILTHQRVPHQERPQAASVSRMNTSQRQSFDFLSLSAGGVSTEANSSCNEVCNAIESMSQLQVPYLHSAPQHQSLLHFSAPPTRYAYACTDHLSTATATQQVHLQLPQYLSNPFCDPYTSHSGGTKQQQQQQQRLWAAHQVAQHRNHGTWNFRNPDPISKPTKWKA